MNLFKINDKNNSSYTSNDKNNQQQGQIMNASTEKKPVEPVKPVINSPKPESSDIEKKNALVAPNNEPVVHGNKQ